MSSEIAASGGTARVTLPGGRTVEVPIPCFGAKEVLQLRGRGEGLPGLDGGEAGDAFITVTIAPTDQAPPAKARYDEVVADDREVVHISSTTSGASKVDRDPFADAFAKLSALADSASPAEVAAALDAPACFEASAQPSTEQKAGRKPADNDVSFALSAPDITRCMPTRAFRSNSFVAFLVKDAEDHARVLNRPTIFNYPYTLAVFRPPNHLPIFCVALEESVMGTSCLGVFDKDFRGHQNLGPATPFRGEKAFVNKAIELVEAKFGERMTEIVRK